MKLIETTDVWTEQFADHFECMNGAFIDGVENGCLPYDEFKIVKNCNCKVTTNDEVAVVGNKHHALVFYKQRKVVRLMVLMHDTNVEGGGIERSSPKGWQCFFERLDCNQGSEKQSC